MHTRFEQVRCTLAKIIVPDESFLLSAQMRIACEVDGHQTDITLTKAAATLTIVDGRIAY